MNHHALVIDDDPEIQSVVRDRIESLTHTCDTAGSQEEARKFIERGGYSYVLLDLEIPVAYGRPPRIAVGKNMIQEIRGTHGFEQVPVLVITAHGVTELAVDVMKQGAVDFVTKPFRETGQTLEKSITEALEKAAREARTSGIAKSRKPSAHKRAEPEEFTGGEMVIFPDRIELCGVQICNGSDDGGSIRRILEALTEKTQIGKFRNYSGSALAKKLQIERGQPAVAEAVSAFRKKLPSLMLDEANLQFGRDDVIASGNRGYQLAERITIRHVGITQVPEPPELVMRVAAPPEEAELNHRQQWILAEIRKGKKLRRVDVMQKFSISVPTAKRDLAGLGDLIEFVGPARGGFYK